MVERIKAIKGGMFSGKTEEIWRLAGRAEHAGRIYQIFKPIIDDRGEGLDKIKSRAGREREATSVTEPLEILSELKDGVTVAFVDEVQFFNQTDTDGTFQIVRVAEELAGRDIEVNVAGLPKTFAGKPFGPMPELLAIAQEITELTAICTHDEGGMPCGRDATETQRFVGDEPARVSDPIVLIGDKKDGYDARCIDHWKVRPAIDEEE